MLLPLLDWVLGQLPSLQDCRLIQQFAEPDVLQVKSAGLAGKVAASMNCYPCDLLFIHRDAEKESREKRLQEIHQAMSPYSHPPFVCLVPVRMSEAWLLIDPDAIRRAADNPFSRASIDLPRLRDLEDVPDPKKTLQDLLMEASELRGRRRDRFRRDLAWRCQRVGEFVQDFSSLLKLDAFAAFHEETLQAVEKAVEQQPILQPFKHEAPAAVKKRP